MQNQRTVNPGEIYRHFKGNLYQVVSIAKHSETMEKYVVYQALYGDMGVWVRPYDMFVSEVDHEKYPEITQKYRFEKAETLFSAATALASTASQAENAASANTVSQAEKTASSNTVSQTKEAASDVFAEDVPDERLIKFLDAPTYAEKLEYLRLIRNNLDERLINDIAVSLDITVDEGDIDSQYYSLRSCLETMARFECNRFR